MELEEAIKILNFDIKKWKIKKQHLDLDISTAKINEHHAAVETVLKELDELKFKYQARKDRTDTIIKKQEKMIELLIKHICDIIDNDDNASLLPFYNSDDNIEEKVKQYFEKKAGE